MTKRRIDWGDEFELGSLVRDKITRFEGIVIARTEWLTNCDRVTLQPQGLGDKGEPLPMHSFDVSTCELLKPATDKKMAKLQPSEAPIHHSGSPRPEPRRGVR